MRPSPLPAHPAAFRRAPCILLVLAFGVTFSAAASRPAPRARHAMISGPEPIAVQAGLEILREGGNAVDAAAAMGFVLAVTWPQAGNLGGGGYMLLTTPSGEAHFIDYRETAPAAATASMFLGPDGQPVPGLSTHSWRASGVPGSVAGLALALERHGTLPLARLVQPAIRLAREGFPVGRGLERALAAEADRLGRWPATRSIFFTGGRPLREGERLVQKDLARTLEAIAARGAAGFYDGPVAAAFAREMAANEGLVTGSDLAAYRPLVREPLRGRYRGLEILAAPPSSSGGVALLSMLAMLEPRELVPIGHNASAHVHLGVEAMRRAFADRSRWLGDPGFVTLPLRGLLSPRYALERMAGFDPDRATLSSALGPGDPLPHESGATTHWSVLDAAGGAVANTTTINDLFGNGAVVPGLGFLLNDEMDDFSVRPGVPNQYGLVGGEANRIEPGKRMLSSMSPTIVLAPSPAGPAKPRLVLGSPGGPVIITAVLQTILNVVDFGMELQAAVDAPRFHHQWLPDRIFLDRGGFPADVLEGLRRRGHAIEERQPRGEVLAIVVDPNGEWIHGAADARGWGVAMGY